LRGHFRRRSPRWGAAAPGTIRIRWFGRASLHRGGAEVTEKARRDEKRFSKENLNGIFHETIRELEIRGRGAGFVAYALQPGQRRLVESPGGWHVGIRLLPTSFARMLLAS